MSDNKEKDASKKLADTKSTSKTDTDPKVDTGQPTVKTRSDSKERTSMEMPTLSRSSYKSESKSEPHLSRSESKEKISSGTRSESKERLKSEKSDGTSKSKESSQLTRSESRESTRASKSDSGKAKTESKHGSKTESPDKSEKKSSKYAMDGTEKKSKSADPAPETSKDPEHKEPIKLKLSLSQIRSYKSSIPDDSDSATSYEEASPPIDYSEKKKAKKRDGSSGKKKRSKDKDRSRKSKAQSVDADSLAPPELELMETGDATGLTSDAETSLIQDPEPLGLPEEMDVSTDSAPAGLTGTFPCTDDDDQENVKMCSFCACGKKSLLGQGELCRYDPTPGFNAFKRVVQKSSKKPATDTDDKAVDKSQKAITSRRQHREKLKNTSRDTFRSPRRGLDDEEGFDELATVGFMEDTEMTAVFEPSGHTWAHHCCAAWSEGVIQNEDCVLKFVDKAVVSGLSKKCNYCQRYGATINCRYPRCSKIYHYPCASGGGCFQDIKTLSLLCPEHTEEAQTIAGEEAVCVVCNVVGIISEQLFCTSCGHHYHGNCLHPPVEVNPTVRAGWQCPDCKICQMCRQPGDDSKMLVCDMCDKGYHTFCLRPVMTTIPKNGWKCKNCRICEDCDSRTPGMGKSSRWHHNYTVCDSCYQQRNKGLSCPLCGKAYRHFSNKAMVQCNLCKKLVHSECDENIDAALLLQVKNDETTDYMCTICRNRDPDMDMPDFPLGVAQMIEDSSDSMIMAKGGLLDSEMQDEDSSQHSSQFLNEDSLSSMDIDLNYLEKVGMMSPSYMFPGGSEVGLGKGKLVAIARKKMSIASKAKNKSLVLEKRKRPLTFGEKRRGPKAKIMNLQHTIGTQSSKKRADTDDDDDDDHPNTIVLANKADVFTFDQDLCKSCGSFGKGEEGKMVVCTQCGQCYHPYCANIKVTRIVIQKGWRCLDCTVCEGCGKNHDEARLLLCDECDISFHTYCLDPPLDHVPKGTWKCKWCVMCLICTTKTPGFGCQWQCNYTHCGPCHSKISCPLCRMKYQEDELIIQCVQCDRWLHAHCDGVFNEDDAERAADFGYHCIMCRPRTGQQGPLPPLPPKPIPEDFYHSFPPPREPEPPKYLLMDGIMITTQAKKLIEQNMMEAPKIKRNRRWGKKPEGWDDRRGEIEKKIEELVAERQMSQDSESSTPALSRLLSIGSCDDEEKGNPDAASIPTTPTVMIPREAGEFKSQDGDLKSPDESEMDAAGIPQMRMVLEAEARKRLEDERKAKQKRKVNKIGVGGFVVKNRFKQRVKRPMQAEGGPPELGEDGQPRPPMEGEEGMPQGAEEEKPKKLQRKGGQGRRKSQLQENFPSYMQEAFFGSDLLIKSREDPKETLKSLDSDEERSLEQAHSLPEVPVREESAIEVSGQIKKELTELPKPSTLGGGMSDKDVADLDTGDQDFQLPEEEHGDDPDLNLDNIDIDENFIKMIESELDNDLSTDLLEDTEAATAAESDEAEKPSKGQEGSENLDDLDDEKSAVLDDTISMLSAGLTHIDSKTVEDIFKGVLQGQGGQGETGAQPPQPPQSLAAPPTGPPTGPPHPGKPGQQQQPLPHHAPPQQLHQTGAEGQGFPHLQLPSSHAPGLPELTPSFPGYPPEFEPPHHPPMPSQFPGYMPSWPPQVMHDDVPSQDSSRRNMQKWESDEDLGDDATISPILYCNMEHPELKQQYPDWSERSKQIAKIWRKLTPDEKQPYLLKARKNRGNSKVRPKPVRKPPMQMQKPEMYPNQSGQPGMQSPIQSSPGGMQSPMRPGMVPGTPEAQSPSHHSPSHSLPGFPGTGPDPYHQMPSTPRPGDPYAMPPPTPRGQEYGGPPGTPRGPGVDPFGQQRKPGDPYGQPPSTPRPEHGSPQDQFRSPVRNPDQFGHSPNMPHASEPYMVSPGGPRPHPGVGTRMSMPPGPNWPGGPEQEGFDRQPPMSQPNRFAPPGAAPNPSLAARFERQMSDSGSQGPVSGPSEDPYSFPSPSDPFSASRPDTMVSTATSDPYTRPPRTPQTQMSSVFPPPQRHPMPGDGQVPGMPRMRMPPGMMRPHGFNPEFRPGMPGMRPPVEALRHMEPSALQQMVAAANRRQLPLSRMWPPFLQEMGAGPSELQKQQVLEKLARQTIVNLQKKEQGEEGLSGDMGQAGFHGGPRPPHPPHTENVMPPGHPLDVKQPISEMEKAKMMRVLQEKIKEVAAVQGYIKLHGHPPAGAPQGGPHGMVPSSSASEPTPGTSGAGLGPAGTGEDDKDGVKKEKPAKAEGETDKPTPGEDDKHEFTDGDLGDFLSADGTFDILKWADPDLDLGSDNKTIFDDLVEDTKSNEEEKKPGVKEGTKTEVKAETEGEEKSDQERPSSVSEYQAKFLEFSQRKSVDENTAAATSGKKGAEGGKSGEAGSIGQIAALLQGRSQSVKSEGGDGSDAPNAQTPTTPGTPATPGDGSMMRAGYPPGVPSPHQSAMYGQPSPSGLPSPKIMPSPKSMPSPRTPGEVQPSPFSQHSAHSPFSPNATSASSAPQSPYAGVNVRTQSPFAVPVTTGGQGYINQESPVGSSHSPAHTPPFPMQRSPRANTPQAQQFMQGQFPQQGYLQGPPPRGMPPGQPQGPFNQAGMRQQVPGMRPGTPVGQASPGLPPHSGTEIPQGIRPMHPGMRLERPPFPGHPPTSPGMQGQPPTPGAMFPGGPVRASQPGQQPQTPPQSFMNQPHMSLPQSTVSAGKPSPTLTTAGQRPSLLEDQPLLIQDLLEQEKLEQQKRQREQQQAMMQRERGGMMGPRPGVPPGMVGMPPGMVPRMEGPARMPTQPPGAMFAQPEMPPGMRPRMPGQLSPHAQGPSQFGIPPGSMPGQGGQMPPPKPPQPGETGPEAERQHMQYDHWLMKHGEYLDMQMKFLDQQIQKQKRTKKAINARNRQAKKNGQEMPPQDVMELERASQEHTMLQKQLEQIRKQNRQHQITIQDYRGKQQERFAQQQMIQGGQPPPGTMPNMPPGAMPPGAMPPGSTMQPPQVRMPGMQGSARLTATRRQEYDAYMQSRLRQMSQGMVPGMPGQPGGPRPQAPPGPRMALGDNNPFSDTYQQQEQIDKLREKQTDKPDMEGKDPGAPQGPPTQQGPQGPPGHTQGPQGLPQGSPGHPQGPPGHPQGTQGHPQGPPGTPGHPQGPPGHPQGPPGPPAAGQGMVPFQDPRFPGPQEGQPQRFPPPMEGQGWMPQRFPFEGGMGPRMPVSAGDPQRFPGPGFPRGQAPPNFPPGAQTTQPQAPPGKPPPVQFKPQDETERRIMEILHSTANLQRGQSPATSVGTPTSSPATIAAGSTLAQTTQGDLTASASQQATGSPSPVVNPQQQPAQQQQQQTLQQQALNQTQPQTTAVSTASTPQGQLTAIPASKTPPVQGRLTPGAVPSPKRPTTLPTPPTLQAAPSLQQSNTSQQQVSHAASLPSLQPAPGLQAGVNTSIAQLQQHQQQVPQTLPKSMAAIVSTDTGKPQFSPHAMDSNPSPAPRLPFQIPPGANIPPGHPAYHMRHMTPQQAQEMAQHMQQHFPGFPHFEAMQGHRMTRPPVLPHWVAPGTTVPGAAQQRRSPRPSLPSIAQQFKPGGIPPISVTSSSDVVTTAGIQAHTKVDQGPSAHIGAPGSAPGPIETQGTQVNRSTQPTSGIRVGSPRQFHGYPNMSSPREQSNIGSPRQAMPHHSAGSPRQVIPQNPAGSPRQAIPQHAAGSPRQAMPHQSAGSPRQAIPQHAAGSPRQVIPQHAAGSPRQVLPQHSAGSPRQAMSHHSAGSPRQAIPQHAAGSPRQGFSQHASGSPRQGSPHPGQGVHHVPNESSPRQANPVSVAVPQTFNSSPGSLNVISQRQMGVSVASESVTASNVIDQSSQQKDAGTKSGNTFASTGVESLLTQVSGNLDHVQNINEGSLPPLSEIKDLQQKSQQPDVSSKYNNKSATINSPANSSESKLQTEMASDIKDASSEEKEETKQSECSDGKHCGTPPPEECNDGIHCGTPPPCTDGVHCGTPPPCTDGKNCGTPPPCTDGIHCGTPPPCTDGIHRGTPPPCPDGVHCGTPTPCPDGKNCGTPPPCTDGQNCGTPPPCTDGVHCGTPPPCTDGIHCGTPPPCTDGVHCGTPPPCTDGIHCGTPPPCTDGVHCGTPPPCPDGVHCGTPPPCTDGVHCSTPPPCTDGVHCGTPPPCTDGVHCGTPPPCTDGVHCGTPPPCPDGIHCGTPPPCTDGVHCGTPPPCTDGIHCGTPPPCTDGVHCGTPPPCTDGIHCGTPPPCTDGVHCGTPPPCTDGVHCGTPTPCTDGKNCGTPPPCTDGQNCGTPPPCTDGQNCGTPPPCTDGKNCGTPPPCTNGQNCGTPPPCSDGQNCGTPPPCSDGQNCGTPPPCTDGQNCGTPPPCTDGQNCGTPPPCTDGQNCGTPPPCTDGQNCGTPPPCSDGQNCGTPPPCTDCQNCGTPPPCTDGQNCGTPPPCTDGQHCGTPPPCTDGQNCGTPPPCTDGQNCGTPPPCTDGQNCGTPPLCTDGQNCGTPPPCTDGQHCGTPPPCTDGQNCGTPPLCTDGQNCGTPPPCTDGQNCGTPPPCTDGKNCGTPPPCTDGKNCGTPPPCTDGRNCGTPPPCTDGKNCGTPPPCTDGKNCGTPPPCTDGKNCGTPPPCTDGKNCGTPPPCKDEGKDGISPQNSSQAQKISSPTQSSQSSEAVVTASKSQELSSSDLSESSSIKIDPIITDIPPPSLQPMISPQQRVVQEDHQYVTMAHPPTLRPTAVTQAFQTSSDVPTVTASEITPTPVAIHPSIGSAFVKHIPSDKSTSPKLGRDFQSSPKALEKPQDNFVKEEQHLAQQQSSIKSTAENSQVAASSAPVSVTSIPTTASVSLSAVSTLSSAASVSSPATTSLSNTPTSSHSVSISVHSHPQTVKDTQQNSASNSAVVHTQVKPQFTQESGLPQDRSSTNITGSSLSAAIGVTTSTGITLAPGARISAVTADIPASGTTRDASVTGSVTGISAVTGVAPVTGTAVGTGRISEVPSLSTASHTVQSTTTPLTSVDDANSTAEKDIKKDGILGVSSIVPPSSQNTKEHFQPEKQISTSAEQASNNVPLGIVIKTEPGKEMPTVEPNTEAAEIMARRLAEQQAVSTHVTTQSAPTHPSLAMTQPKIEPGAYQAPVTTIPRPQHYGPLPHFTGENRMQRPPFTTQSGGMPYPGHMQQAGRQPFHPAMSHEGQVHRQMHPQYQRPQIANINEMRQRFPGHPMFRPRQFPPQQPGQSMSSAPGDPSQYAHMPRPDGRQWPPGMPFPREQMMHGPNQVPRHPVSAPGTTVSDATQRYTLNEHGHPQPTSQESRLTSPGQTSHYPVTSNPEVKPPVSGADHQRYQLQGYPGVDPRFPVPHSVPGQTSQEQRYFVGQGIDPRHPFPNQQAFQNYYQQRAGQGPMPRMHGPGMQQAFRHGQPGFAGDQHRPPMDPNHPAMRLQRARLPGMEVQGQDPTQPKPSHYEQAPSIGDQSVQQPRPPPQRSASTSSVASLESEVKLDGSSGPGSKARTPQSATPPVQSGSQPNSQRSTPQPHQSPMRPPSGQRASPAQGQSPAHSTSYSHEDLQLPSVSATFAAAGMMRLGENASPAQPPFSSASSSVTGNPGFSSVSSIVQTISTVSFPSLSTQGEGPVPQPQPPVPTEVSLPPSTGIKSTEITSLSAGTQTPVHSKPQMPTSSQAQTGSTGEIPEQTPGQVSVGAPNSMGMPVSSVQHDVKPVMPIQSEMGPSFPPQEMPHGPRMPLVRPPGQQFGAQPHPTRPRGQKQQQQPYGHQQRFPPLPSNLPPHLAGMLTGMRGQMPPNRPMYSPQERHPGMPVRYPPGHPMSMAPGGPRQYPGPLPQSIPGDVTNSQPSSQPMQMSPGIRPPGMMQHPGMGMRHPGQMRHGAPGGPMPGQHPMMQMRPSQMSPTGHPGAPMMHPGMHPTSAGMMRPQMGQPHIDLPSPTLRHPGAPPTPGSLPSTPSPQPAQYQPGMPPSSSGVIPSSTAPGYPGEMPNRPPFPYHRPRMPFDPRIHMDPNMHPRMQAGNMQHPGSMGMRFPPDFHMQQQQQGMPQSKPGGQPEFTSHAQFEEAMKRMAASQAGTNTTPSATPSATPPTPSSDHGGQLSWMKQEHTPGATDSEGLPLRMDEVSQNALLKKLLAKSTAAAAAAAAAQGGANSGHVTPQSVTDQSEDSSDYSNIQLTPEQQRQLEMIDKMPLTTQKTLPDPLPPDLNDPDIEAKRQEFERRRKEMEEARREKRKEKDGTKKRVKTKKGAEGLEKMPQPMIPGQGPPMGPFDPQMMMDKRPGQIPEVVPGIVSPEREKTKKRNRKTKKEKAGVSGEVTENLDTILETFNHQLKQLPPVPLMEPHVGHTYAICSLVGSSTVTNGESLLSGMYGKTQLLSSADYYEELLMGIQPSLDIQAKKEAEKKKQLAEEKEDLAGLTDDQKQYKVLMDSIHGEGQGSSPPFGLGSLGIPRGVLPPLPPQPRVEPRPLMLKMTDSPDSVISSSSPETGFDERDLTNFPMLRPIDPPAQDEETRTSPTVPLLQPVPIKPPAFMLKNEQAAKPDKIMDIPVPRDVQIPTAKGKQELDSALSLLAGKENRMSEVDPITGLARARDTKEDGEVSVTLTLSAKAAEDIGGVLSAIADLLKIAAPPTYEVSRSPSPDHSGKIPTNLKHKEEALNIQSLLKSRSPLCRYCDASIVNTGIRIRKGDIPVLNKDLQEDKDEMVTFCGSNCYINFTVSRQVIHKPAEGDTSALDLPQLKDSGLLSPKEVTPSSSVTGTPAVTPSSGVGPESMDVTPGKSGPPTPQLGSPTLLSKRMELEALAKRSFKRSHSITEAYKQPLIKKWKDKRYKRFEFGMFPETIHAIPVKEPEEEGKLWSKLTCFIRHDKESMKDKRMCEFCQEYGDGDTNGTGRLLNLDIDKWCHLNCALWSQEVYETLNGALMNVQQAYKRSMKQKCVVCVKPGASLSCFKNRCNNIYHVPCAQLVGCVFFEDKTILCPPHTPKGVQMDQVLKSLVVYRKVYINRDEDIQVANMLLQEDGQHTLRLGSLVLHNIGQLLPHQMASGKFNNRDHMYPVGYKTTRFYWSMRSLYKRCRYICSIAEQDGLPEFVITVVEDGHKDLTLQNPSCTGVWRKVLEPLEHMRKEADLVKVFPSFTTGEELYGLNDPNIVRLIESLPGTDLLKEYVFKFGRRQLIDLPLTINPTGCARTEPKLRTHFKKPHTLQSSSTHSLPSTVTGLTGDLNSPYMKHFVHSKSQQYRRLKTEWKNLVYLGRSRIQGLGLYAAKDLEMHTMVIEYIGDLIRNEVANSREKFYESQNRGVYMFRIDDNTVVDATMAGGPARYINHSCDPNCVAEVVEIDKESKIIIITNRRIQKGEELTYDYQFDFEDDQHKIPCTCGANNCRKWMN